MAGSTRGRSSSQFENTKSTSSISSSSSTSSLKMNNNNGKTTIPRPSSSSPSLYGSGNGINTLGLTPSQAQSDSMYNQGSMDFGGSIAAGNDDVIPDTIDTSAAGDSISVTVRFRPLSEREFQRGDEIAWYPDGDKIVQNEPNPALAYAFGISWEILTTVSEDYQKQIKLWSRKLKGLIYEKQARFRSPNSPGGMHRPSSGGYGDEDRYGSRDDDRNGYGREREYGYKDDDRNNRSGDSYSRDGDHYGRDSDGNYKDGDYNRGRIRSNEEFQSSQGSRSSDRYREHGFDDDRYSSRQNLAWKPIY